MNSLRRRLIIWFTCLLVSGALVGGVAAYFLTREDPDNFLDDQLRQIALYAGDQPAIPDPTSHPAVDPTDIVVVQIWDAAGRLLRSTPPGIDVPRQETTGFFDVTAAGERWRTYALVDVGRAVQVSQRAAVREELALNAALPAVIPSLVLIPLCWLLVRWLVGRILRPLDELAAQLAARGPESTDALTTAAVPEEIAPLVAAVNAAFGRLGHAMALQRQFVSDAAHQLRTPLTALRLQLENVKRSPNADVSDVLADMDSGLRRMSALTGQLLALARAQAAPEPAASEPISLGRIVREAVSSVLPLAHSRGVVVETSFGSDIHVLADRGELVVMVLNVLDNAVRYTGRGGRVEVDFRREEVGALIEVTDTGPGLPEDMLARVFERFVRHNDDEHGTGLGLAIAKAIADRIGARITLRNREQGTGLSALVAFPSGSTRE